MEKGVTPSQPSAPAPSSTPMSTERTALNADEDLVVEDYEIL